MEILTVISRLMDYPDQAVADHKDEICQLIGKAREISPAHRARLQAMVDETYRGDLMDAEERYTGLFEQGRSLSLHLFEHVHGESRDRGQAMVDLSRIVHDVAFMVVVLTLLVHIYFALFPRNKYGLEAMFRTGVIDEDIVREHHGVWYDKIKHDSDAFEDQK